MEFVKLTVEDYGHRTVNVVCVKETAEYFGWDKAFPEWRPRTHIGPSGGELIYLNRRQNEWCWPGGVKHRICRHVSKHSYPKQATNVFRMQGAYSAKHLKALAVAAGNKFEWMSTRKGERVSRAVWQS